MITIPVPLTNFEDWTNVMIMQDSSLSDYDEKKMSWKTWVNQMYSISPQYIQVNPETYPTWDKWAWDFLYANQGG